MKRLGLLLVCLLTACGGGSDDVSEETTTTVRKTTTTVKRTTTTERETTTTVPPTLVDGAASVYEVFAVMDANGFPCDPIGTPGTETTCDVTYEKPGSTYREVIGAVRIIVGDQAAIDGRLNDGFSCIELDEFNTDRPRSNCIIGSNWLIVGSGAGTRNYVVRLAAAVGGQVWDPSTAAPRPPAVVYEVVGRGQAQVTYSVAGFGQEQQDVTMPWRHELQDTVDFAQVLAQIKSEGSITCRIYRNGELVSEQTSNGAYVVVHCADD